MDEWRTRVLRVAACSFVGDIRGCDPGDGDRRSGAAVLARGSLATYGPLMRQSPGGFKVVSLCAYDIEVLGGCGGESEGAARFRFDCDGDLLPAGDRIPGFRAGLDRW